MKNLILTFIVVISFMTTAAAQAPAFSTTTSRDAEVTGDRAFRDRKIYDHNVDTTFDDQTLMGLQVYISGKIAVQEVITRSQTANGRRVAAKTLTVEDGTPGKIMKVISKDTLYELAIDGTDTVKIPKGLKPRTVLISFTTKEVNDILVPFSAAPGNMSKDSISGDEQFTTSHLVANQKPLYTFKMDGKMYLIAGTGTLLYHDSKSKHHTGRGRRYDQ